MKLKYIGRNDDRGLINGRVYECRIRDVPDRFGFSYIELQTINYSKHTIILYTSFDTLFQNWEELK